MWETELQDLKQQLSDTNRRLDDITSLTHHLSVTLNETMDRLAQEVGASNDLRSQVQSLRSQIESLTRLLDEVTVPKSVPRPDSNSKLLHDKETDDKLSRLSLRLQQVIAGVRSDSEQSILLNQRIIIVSLSIVALPISCLLILILYLTLRRDRKTVKSEQRLALNEMNHLRRYNDY